MPAPEQMLDLYLHLACAAETEARPLTRDKFLILAAGVAQTAGYAGIAEDCRLRVLEHNPNHMLKYFATVREALRSSEIRHYVRQLLRLYPFEKAEFLLQQYRAGGYEGHHGYLGLDGGSAPQPKQRRRRRRPPNQTSETPKRPGMRPSLERAFAKVEQATQRRGTAVSSVKDPAIDEPQELTTQTQFQPFDRARFWSVLILAFSMGALIGGLSIATLFPAY